MQETGDLVQSLGWDDPLEEEMANHSSILAWRIPQTVDPAGLLSIWSQRVRHDWAAEHACVHLPLTDISKQSITFKNFDSKISSLSHFAGAKGPERP